MSYREHLGDEHDQWRVLRGRALCEGGDESSRFVRQRDRLVGEAEEQPRPPLGEAPRGRHAAYGHVCTQATQSTPGHPLTYGTVRIEHLRAEGHKTKDVSRTNSKSTLSR